jgi:hypothetical protein
MTIKAARDATAMAAAPPRDPPDGPASADRPERERADDQVPEIPPGYGPDPDYGPDGVEPDPTPALPDPPAERR